MTRLRLRHAMAAAIAGAALSLWWSLHAAGPDAPSMSAVRLSEPTPSPAAMSVHSTAVAPVRAAIDVRCAAGTLRWQAGSETAPSCVATRGSSLDSGNLHSDRFESLQGDGRWLRIDSIGRRVVGVQAGGPGTVAYGCRKQACGAVSIGESDLQGVRRIALGDLVLGSFGSTPGSLRLSGSFDVAGHAEGDPACAGQSVSMARGDGVLVAFCPQDGTALTMEDDGGLTYAYSDTEGHTITVRIDAQGALQSIESGGLRCAQAGCVGAEVSAPDANGLRTLQLHGALLQGSGGWTLLDGQLLLPS